MRLEKSIEHEIKELKESISGINKEMFNLHGNTLSHISEASGVSKTSFDTFMYNMNDLMRKREGKEESIRTLILMTNVHLQKMFR